MRKKAVIFDIDGTLFDDSHRKHLVEAGKWAEYFAAGANDTPHMKIIAELKAQRNAGRAIVLMTGCPEQHRKITEAKLARAGVVVDALLMRPDNSFVKNHDLKAAWLNEMSCYDFIAAFDDMPGSVAAFKTFGINAHLVKNGVICG